MSHHYRENEDDFKPPSDDMYILSHLLLREVGEYRPRNHLHNVLFLLDVTSKNFSGLLRYMWFKGPYYTEIGKAVNEKWKKDIDLEEYELSQGVVEDIRKLVSLIEETKPKNTDFVTWTDRITFLAYLKKHHKSWGEATLRANIKEEFHREDVSRRFKAINKAYEHVLEGMK
jgi:hypothetical protein